MLHNSYFHHAWALGVGTGTCARTWHYIDELLTVLAGEGSGDEGELDEDNFLIDELDDGSLALRARRSGPSSRSGRRNPRSGRSGKRWRPDDREGSPNTARQCFPCAFHCPQQVSVLRWVSDNLR